MTKTGSGADNQPNIHATGLILADRGILIAGTSGSGKTTLALTLLNMARGECRFSRLVSDDQLFLRAASGRLLALAPESIGGLAEVHGSGIHVIAHEPRMQVHLIVRLHDTSEVPRFQADAIERLHGIDIPLLDLAHRNALAAALAVCAKLSLPPFAQHPLAAPVGNSL